MPNPLTIDPVGDRQLVITRDFDAPREPMFLIGLVDRLIVFATSEPPTAIWKATSPVVAALVRRMMTRDCRVTGGERLGEPGSPTLVVPGPLLVSADAWFQPLLSWRPRAERRREFDDR